MKFSCQCGQVIRDGTDFIPYKAMLLADQDQISMIDEIVAQAKNFLSEENRSVAGPAQLPQEQLDAFERAVWQTCSKYLHRVMYQCLNCGRIFVDDRKHTPKIRSFAPDDPSWISLLGSIKGDDSYPWSTSLVGSWDQTKGEGCLWWYPPPGKKGGYETFDSQEAVEHRYHELFESLKADGILKDARLGIQMESGPIKDIHNCPPRSTKETKAAPT